MLPTLSFPTALLRVAEYRIDAEAEVAVTMQPGQLAGILCALVGAILLSFGAQYQSRGLNKVERMVGESAGSGLSLRHIGGMLRRPSWVVGTVLLGLAVVFQIGSLSLSPIIVVQPIGVVALVITAVLNSRMSGVQVGARAMLSIGLAVGGIVVFVTVAALSATDRTVTDAKLLTILITFGVVFAAALILFFLLRLRRLAIVYIVGAGTLYGFVATFAKAIIGRLQQGEFEWLTVACVVALVAGALLGMVFVQNAYSSGPPDLVVAGLTVIDPIVAVLIGIVVLGEAQQASGPAVAGFIVAGVIAIVGVLGLAKYHPQVGRSALEARTGPISTR